MSSVFVDASDGYVGLILGNQYIINEGLNKTLQKTCGEMVHMRELTRSKKLKIAYVFSRSASSLCKKQNIQLICAGKNSAFVWIEKFVERQFRMKRKIPFFYVDVGMDLEIRKNIDPFYFRIMKSKIIVGKSFTQCSDVLSWINLRRKQIRLIWNRLVKHVLEMSNEKYKSS